MEHRYRIGPDIDLDAEDVRLRDGTRLTEALAEEMAEEAVAAILRARGRRALEHADPPERGWFE